jgi:hypothetical protein
MNPVSVEGKNYFNVPRPQPYTSYLALEPLRAEPIPTVREPQMHALYSEQSGVASPGNSTVSGGNTPDNWHFLAWAASIFRNHLFLNLLVQDITPG